GETHGVSRLSRRGDSLLRLVASMLDLAELRIERIDGRARLRQTGLDGRALVHKASERAVVRRQRFNARLDLELQLVSSLRQVLLLSEHACERRARRLLRVAARFHLDRELVRNLSVLLGRRSRFGNHALMAVPLGLELLS